MILPESFLAYTLACLILVLAPGADNLLSIGRGMSQGKFAAMISGCASGMGILFHVLTATLGLTLLIQTSEFAFYLVKIIGALYLVWLGIKVLKSKGLFNLQTTEKQSLKTIFLTGFLSAALNPKPGLFVLAFIPQFIQPELGSVTTQMFMLGSWFAILTTLGFSSMGFFSSYLSKWLFAKPKFMSGLNIGAGLTFIFSGLAIAFMRQK
ncbi:MULTISPECIES: LysE family translocator [unclassified Acinetobacter]|uniref:LysE family translocator n=1 Tax=unclassified Acinetobacter TaxID=196816 RepID=UPI0029351076|nr:MULTISPECIES: LysE family translocator [unclassified Acinetobacter]WOE31596.1 LysE family translocator [Acinetobacter sp. SAAs470]WOE37061.1 LysE family translocator [Acinetobacter sp. SAAs474]